MAIINKAASTRDFNLCFISDQTPAKDVNAAFRKKWDWVVSSSGQNAYWYAVIIGNLHQTARLPKMVTMDFVREAVTSGINRAAFDRLKLLTQSSSRDLGEVMRIPMRTLSRREVFHPDESERLLRVASAFQKAIEVFEDLDKARQWFSKPKRALGNESPLQFCDTDIGAKEVINLLGRIEQGVFS